MSIEGQITIHMTPHDKGYQVEIGSSRPVNMVKIFHGKEPHEILALLPMVYSICGTAQGITSLNAFESALGRPTTVANHQARQLLINIETIREHLWRISLDWPQFLNSPIKPYPDTRASTWVNRTKSALYNDGNPFQLQSTLTPDLPALNTLLDEIEEVLSTQVFGITTEQWLNFNSLDTFESWLKNKQTVAAQLTLESMSQDINPITTHFLPPLENEELAAILQSSQGAAFAAAPQWHRQCAETTPLARQSEMPLIRVLINKTGITITARLTARLLELAHLLADIKQAIHLLDDQTEMNPSPHGAGLAQVEAARGRLIHCVNLNEGVVSDYRIVAPTEWNFHPEGVVKQSLQQMKNGNQNMTVQQAHLLINAIDPCVAYQLTVN